MLACSTLLPSWAQQPASLAQLEQSFANPPDDCRIMMRWWWFGPAVTKPELQRELEQMKAEGIGGVEIATLYPLALDDPQTGFHNQQFLSDEHLDAIRFAAATAKKLGLRVDITLTSGWPYGGPHIPVTQAAGALRVESISVPPGADSVAVPDIDTGEQLIAAFLAPVVSDQPSRPHAKQVSKIVNGRLQVSDSNTPSQAIFFISSRTGMMVNRPAVGAEGFVLDHYDQGAIETHLHAVGDRLLQAFGDNPPYAIFSDSLEDEGSNWTGDFLQQFRARRGYDLIPHLPALIGDIGPLTAAVRHDWGKTLTELVNERYLIPLHEWAQQHHTLFRSQTYGFPPVTLSSNRYEDLPEGEGKASLMMWREFSDVRWAGSAGHLFGKSVISSETWTWLHSPAFRATPLDLKAEADLHFLQGINQLVGHGWPYSPAEAGEPGWRMYAAAALNAHNPWSFVMPDLARYLQRVSFALRQGEPAKDVALLLPNDDLWSMFSIRSDSAKPIINPGNFNTVDSNFSMDEPLGRDSLVSKVVPQILDSGFNVDFIDGDAIDSIGIPYAALILPAIDRLPLTTYRKIEEFARNGGVVIAVNNLPSTAPGLVDAESENRQIQQVSQALFRANGAPAHLVSIDSLGASLAASLTPDVIFSPRTPRIGFSHRRLAFGDLYFIANTSNQARHVAAKFRNGGKPSEWLDPFTGDFSEVENPSAVDLDLQPYESRLIVFSDSVTHQQKPSAKDDLPVRTIDLNAEWKISFENANQNVPMAKLHSWSDDSELKYYSGQATYRKSFDLSAADLRAEVKAILDFGAGAPVEEPNPPPEHSMRAYLEGPVREAAEVYVNGQRAGCVWHPPYKLDVTRFLTAGKNDLRIVVGNTAINSLAGRTLPSYRLLNQRYGQRFTPQDMAGLQPLPSGLLGDLQLKLLRPKP
ncbi:MAG TPA: glycosyl hydrolase [Candidatus Sulfotelmatobacter sp.]|nr:glycosyl hydrolase [Candidatus Sulfotelmatobacter sp.]